MPVIEIQGLTKTYPSGLQALKRVDLTIERGEIFALLGPNGAGKTTLISIICGIVNATTGTVVADGHDIRKDFRAARMKIGLVPQELTTDAFETVLATVTFSRGLFGKPGNPALIEQILKDLSLWDKRDAKIMTLSGGMKRRVMIAKALSHEPDILFLDEPTAAMDEATERAFITRFRAWSHERTVVIATHRMRVLDLVDRIIAFDNGQVVLDETKEEALKTLKGVKKVVPANLRGTPETAARRAEGA